MKNFNPSAFLFYQICKVKPNHITKAGNKIPSLINQSSLSNWKILLAVINSTSMGQIASIGGIKITQNKIGVVNTYVVEWPKLKPCNESHDIHSIKTERPDLARPSTQLGGIAQRGITSALMTILGALSTNSIDKRLAA